MVTRADFVTVIPILIVVLAGCAVLLQESLRRANDRPWHELLALIGLVGGIYCSAAQWGNDDVGFGVILSDKFALFCNILLCGIETPVCIYQTSIAALAAGLQVTVLSDAIGARREDDAHSCLAALRHQGAHVLPAETVFYAMIQDVAHPYFRAYTQLVKLHAAVAQA